MIYRQLQRENARLVRTRDALAASERSSGELAERVRLSREIHDTLAQGLSSMHLLLNAADQVWTARAGNGPRTRTAGCRHRPREPRRSASIRL